MYTYLSLAEKEKEEKGSIKSQKNIENYIYRQNHVPPKLDFWAQLILHLVQHVDTYTVLAASTVKHVTRWKRHPIHHSNCSTEILLSTRINNYEKLAKVNLQMILRTFNLLVRHPTTTLTYTAIFTNLFSRLGDCGLVFAYLSRSVISYQNSHRVFLFY